MDFSVTRYLFFGLAIALVIEVFSVLPTANKPSNPANYRKGIFHVHSDFSDGTGTVPEIAEAARASQNDFVVLTDHNTSAARAKFEKRYDGVDVYVELEASTPVGHILAFYSTSAAAKRPDSEIVHLAWKGFLGEEVLPERFFLVAAHPSNVKNPITRLDKTARGLEILNFDSQWQRSLRDDPLGFLSTLFVFPVNRYLGALSLFEPYKDDFATWDNWNGLEPGHFGILAHDTHQNVPLGSLKIKWPSYGEMFQYASNIVFAPRTGSFEKDKLAFFDAVEAGRMAVVFDLIWPFADTQWEIQCPHGQFLSGSRSQWQGGCTSVAKLAEGFPYDADLRIYRNGTLAFEKRLSNDTLKLPLDQPGTYRAEIWARPHTAFRVLLSDPVPFVFFNPIYLE